MEPRPHNGKITKYNQPFIEQRADPYILRHTDGRYYFTATVPSYDGITTGGDVYYCISGEAGHFVCD